MESIREYFCFMIFYDFKNDLNLQECLVSLRETFDIEASSEKSVYNWFSEYRRVRAFVGDKNRKERPKSVVILRVVR